MNEENLKETVSDAERYRNVFCDKCAKTMSEGYAKLSKRDILRPKKLIKQQTALDWICKDCKKKLIRKIRKQRK